MGVHGLMDIIGGKSPSIILMEKVQRGGFGSMSSHLEFQHHQAIIILTRKVALTYPYLSMTLTGTQTHLYLGTIQLIRYMKIYGVAQAQAKHLIQTSLLIQV